MPKPHQPIMPVSPKPKPKPKPKQLQLKQMPQSITNESIKAYEHQLKTQAKIKKKVDNTDITETFI
jgi:hypothetical protein